MFCHLFSLAGLIVPLGWFIGPLVVWLIKKEEYPFVNEQGKESLNWQLTLLIGFLICLPLCLLVVGFVLATALAVVDLVFVILASIKANDGISFRYPYRIGFFK